MNEATWGTTIAGPAVSFACATERWLGIETDPRWVADLAVLKARGFVTGDTSRAGWLARALNVTVFERFYAACLARGHDAPKKTLCKNQLVLHQFVSERWAKVWDDSYWQPARARFPNVSMSDYAVALSTQKYCEIPGVDIGYYGSNCTAGGNFSGAVVGDMQAPSLYAGQNRTFTELHTKVYRLRSHVVAQTSWPHSPRPTTTWPWLADTKLTVTVLSLSPGRPARSGGARVR